MVGTDLKVSADCDTFRCYRSVVFCLKGARKADDLYLLCQEEVADACLIRKKPFNSIAQLELMHSIKWSEGSEDVRERGRE